MLIKELKYSYNDISIVPAVISQINHRHECNPYDKNGFLPIFTAPMSTVVNIENFDLFEKNKIYPILPRNESLENRIDNLLKSKWSAFSLSEFNDLFCNEELYQTYEKVSKKALIDVANGHMKCIYDSVKKAKSLYGDTLKIMIGNIANPETYRECVKANVDFVRVSIGSGMGCSTTSNTSTHYPIASLIDEMVKIKREIIESTNNTNITKIIADGGIRNFSDVNKALALGADYVMIGGLFSSLVESCAKTFYYDINDDIVELHPITDDEVFEENGIFHYKKNNKIHIINKIYKIFYGMASRNGQIDINGKKTKTSEGLVKTIECTTNLYKWAENMTDYLRSAMSYTNCKTLDEFNKNVNCVLISNNTFNSVNK